MLLRSTVIGIDRIFRYVRPLSRVSTTSSLVFIVITQRLSLLTLFGSTAPLSTSGLTLCSRQGYLHPGSVAPPES